MKKFQVKKPDIKGSFHKLKNIKKEDVKVYWMARKERRERILEERRNSAFARKMRPVYQFMNRISLLLHALLACMINFAIEAISRHSAMEAWKYMTGTPLVFLYNAFMIFITFSVVYLVKRRMFVRIIISVLWLALGVANGYMLMKRVTPFNAQDFKVAKDGITLINNYFNGVELVGLAVGIGAVSDLAVEKRVVSTYFGNIAFAYEDYGLPYCFMASVFNTGITEPNDYNEKTITEISGNREITKSETGRAKDELPNIIFIQLESYFDVAEAEFFTTSEDASPNLHAMYENYSSGYFKVPSIGAGTANTEFEVLTGMNLRYFGPGEYPYKTVLKNQVSESAATALGALGYGTHALHNNGGIFTVVPECLTMLALTAIRARSS